MLVSLEVWAILLKAPIVPRVRAEGLVVELTKLSVSLCVKTGFKFSERAVHPRSLHKISAVTPVLALSCGSLVVIGQQLWRRPLLFGRDEGRRSLMS